MSNEAISRAIELFIDKLEINDNNIPEFGIKFKTISRNKIYYAYTNKNRNIMTKPLEGERQFSQPITVFKRYLATGEINKDNDSSYVIPIAEYIKENFLENKKNIKEEDMNVKNIILYGAPGVGKTHNYQRVISMIENGNAEKKMFDIITNNESSEKVELNDEVFQKIKDDKRVEFVTFHQSYSYEDFIEGYRPNESGNIELKNGIFKSIANKANGKIDINKYISLNTIIQSDRTTYIIQSITSDLINIKRENNDRIVPIPTRLLVELLENIDKGNIQLNDIKNRNLDNLNSTFDKYMYGYNSILYAICNSILNKIKYEEQKNFYIVIDEINRGNISKIFGELITLIEEDKRDIYEITLPYSKEPFKVPSNLYIIATVNSTDKSIATIDIALRRRFTFLKMKPNLELVTDEDAKNLMNSLNKFIKDNLNEDYMLGHSYFMGEDIDLEFIKKYKIEPLLEEYFYADDDKLKEVLALLKSIDD